MAEGLERWTNDLVVSGSNPTAVKTFRFGTLAIPFTPLGQCISEKTLEAVDTSIWCLCQGK